MLKFFVFAAFLFGIGLISMYPSQKHELPEPESDNMTDFSLHWPNSTVPYEFEPDYPTHLKHQFHEATEHISSKTCIKYIPRTTQPNYIKIIKGNGQDCMSQVGHLDIGPQEIMLPECCYGNCNKLGKVVHELIHSLGFVHEHCRKDRDKYIEIVWDNIIPEMVVDFEIWEEEWVSSYGVEYDFGSVMHYPSNMHAVDNTSDTIVTKPPGIPIGQMEGMSEGDALKVNRMYDCRVG